MYRFYVFLFFGIPQVSTYWDVSPPSHHQDVSTRDSQSKITHFLVLRVVKPWRSPNFYGCFPFKTRSKCVDTSICTFFVCFFIYTCILYFMSHGHQKGIRSLYQHWVDIVHHFSSRASLVYYLRRYIPVTLLT